MSQVSDFDCEGCSTKKGARLRRVKVAAACAPGRREQFAVRYAWERTGSRLWPQSSPPRPTSTRSASVDVALREDASGDLLQANDMRECGAQVPDHFDGALEAICVQKKSLLSEPRCGLSQTFASRPAENKSPRGSDVPAPCYRRKWTIIIFESRADRACVVGCVRAQRKKVRGAASSLARAPHADRERERSLHREHPDGSALRHFRIFAGEDQVQARLHFRRVDAPAGLDRDVLLAVDLERHR